MTTKRCKSSANWWWDTPNESISSLTGPHRLWRVVALRYARVDTNLVTTNKHTLVSFNSENNLCFAPYLAQSYIDSDEIYREWKCDARSFNDNKLRNCIAFYQSMQWRNKGERGQLPRAQQTRGRKTASPKYFNDHISEFDEVCWLSQ